VKVYRLGIRGKIAAMILICMVPILILGGVLFQYRNQGRRDVVQRSHREGARAIAADVQIFIAGAFEAERTAGAAVTSQPYPVSGIVQLFGAIRARNPLFLSLVLLDRDGGVVAASPAAPAVEVAMDSSVVAVQRGKASAAGAPVWVGRRPTIVGSSAIREGGHLTAIVAGRLDLERLRAILPHAPTPLTDGIVVDNSGRVIIDLRRPDRAAAFQEVGAVQRALAGEEATIDGYRDPATGTRSLGAAVPIPDLGWAAIVIEPESSALESARRAATQELTYVLTAVGVGLFLAWVLGAELSAPILALVRGARTIGRGELGTRVALQRNDELGELGDAFNEMSQRLAGLVREMSALQAVSDAALSTVRLDELLPPLVRQVVAALHADEGMIWFVDERSGSLMQPAGFNGASAGTPRQLARGQGVAGRVAADARSMVISDPAHLAALDPALAAEGTYATVGVPIRAGGRVIGVVQVCSRRPREFTPHEMRLLEPFADRVALAVDNARAFERERELATIIQQTLLPPQRVELPGVTVAGRYLASREVGGDFYAVLPLEEGRVGLAIADVAGKGIPAATLSARARYLLEAFALDAPRPDAVLTRLNRVLAQDADSRFVSLFYGILDPIGGRLAFARAGHPPPILLRPGTATPVPLEAPGLLLGVKVSTPYVTREIPIGPGDQLIMFTDGITEARRPDGEQFGEQQLLALVRTCAGTVPEDVVDRVMDAMATWAGSTPADDQTIVVVRIAADGEGRVLRDVGPSPAD
jgi:serine phosphatase RsbU (regulator of sigma subunit)/HAMP domain-containing protein